MNTLIHRAMVLWVALCWAGVCLAEGQTLWTVSPFAGGDAAAVSYMEILHEWEERTGNTVEDAS